MALARLPQEQLLAIAYLASLSADELHVYDHETQRITQAIQDYESRIEHYHTAVGQLCRYIDSLRALKQVLIDNLLGTPLTVAEATFTHRMPEHRLARAMIPLPLLTIYRMYSQSDQTIQSHGRPVLEILEREITSNMWTLSISMKNDVKTKQYVQSLMYNVRLRIQRAYSTMHSALSTCKIARRSWPEFRTAVLHHYNRVSQMFRGY